MRNEINPVFKSHYTWNDQPYRDFMFDVLLSLEPCSYRNREVLFKELDEFNEIIFIDTGVIGIGYELNKQVKFCLRFENHYIVGAYGLTYQQRARYVYKCFSSASGFFIRRE